VVERGEVVVLVLDLGTLQHGEPEPHEDVLELAPDLRDQVEMAGRQRRVAGQGHVDAVGGEPRVELLRIEPLGALGQQPLERLLDRVRALAHRTALLRRQLADRAQRLRQLGLAPQVAHAQILELGAAPGAGDGSLGLPPQLVESGGGVRHRAPSYSAHTEPPWPPWRR
jgi:hypothetical protein